jgi:hypothetical protein
MIRGKNNSPQSHIGQELLIISHFDPFLLDFFLLTIMKDVIKK